MSNTAWEEFKRQWGVDGMPKDKQRLAEAAWQAANDRYAPVAYRQRIEVTRNGTTNVEWGYADFQVMQGDTTLYALKD